MGDGDTQTWPHLGDDSRTDGATTLAEGKAEARLHCHRGDQLALQRHIVTRHDHFRALVEDDVAGDVSGSEEELRPVVGEEGGVTPTLLLAQAIQLGLKLGVWRNGARFACDL